MAEERAAPRSGSSLTGSYLEREEERRWRTAKAEFSRFRDQTIDSRFSRGTANFEKKKKKEKQFRPFPRIAFFRPVFNQRL